MSRATGSDDLAGLASKFGLDPTAYKTFQGARVKSPVPKPNSEPPASAAAPDPVSLKQKALPEQPRLEQPSAPHTPPVARTSANLAAYSEEKAAFTRTAVPLKNLFHFSQWDRWAALDTVLSTAGLGSVHGPIDLRPKRLSGISIAAVAGGAGASSIAASLARIGARRGNRVLLFDSTADALLPLFFGGRTSSIPTASFVFSSDGNRGAIHTLRTSGTVGVQPHDSWLTRSLDCLVCESEAVVIDAGLNRANLAHPGIGDVIHFLTLVPDTRCLAALKRSEDRRTERRLESAPGPLILLNQFDQSDPLHTEIRARLADRYLHRLVPIPIRRDRQVPAALAEGMTVIEYAPDSSAAEDLMHLDQWIQSRLRQISESNQEEEIDQEVQVL